MNYASLATGGVAVVAVVALIFAIARWRAAAEREKQWRTIAAQGTAEAVRLRSILQTKEAELATTYAALAQRMSPDDLADALNQLFGTGPRQAPDPGPT